VQQQAVYQDVTLITQTAAMSPAVHGGRAKCLQRLIRLDLPVPTTVALSFAAVRKIAKSQIPDIDTILEPFDAAPLLSVPSERRANA